MQKWEYCALKVDSDGYAEGSTSMDELGLEGWELVAVNFQFGTYDQVGTAFFKRPLVEQKESSD